MKKSTLPETQNTIIFRPQGSKVAVEVKLTDETVWLNLNQIALLFGRDKSVISRHLRNIFISKELDKNSTVAFFATVQTEGGRLIERKIECFNLDVIISLGYRVNSKRGIQFRIWATSILKQHLIKGYTINEKRLKEQTENLKTLQRTVQMLAEISQRKALTSDEATGLFEVIRDYSYGLDVLDDYDHGRIEMRQVQKLKLSIVLKIQKLRVKTFDRIGEDTRRKHEKIFFININYYSIKYLKPSTFKRNTRIY